MRAVHEGLKDYVVELYKQGDLTPPPMREAARGTDGPDGERLCAHPVGAHAWKEICFWEINYLLLIV